ncbi:unnamed protein product [Microthlaspi erraticum]|uniref:Uncharacterized protein n=1 Tax=Microthlaspi erraticum TaxID=1685480 RepID=A0A6D2J9P4_9BRAS|nr:unnamed protein product [Microthlaspi erraticum]
MDFIKTSSLRALIELTFQRNWNGLIWMSRKGVTTKRVKTVQTALSRKRPTAERLAEKRMFRSAKSSVRLKSRPKFKPSGRYASRPGKHVPRSAKPRTRHAAHDHAARAGKQSLAAAQPTRVPRPMAPSEPGSTSRVRPRKHRPILTRPTTAADRETIRPRPFRHDHDPIVRPIVPRPSNAAVDPKPVLKPVSCFQARLNPKPPLKT